MADIEFAFGNRVYQIDYHFYNIVQLVGDSASGKSLLYSDFLSIQKIDEETNEHKYTNCLLINKDSKDRLSKLFTGHVYDIVIINNADLIITPEIDMLIFEQVVSRPTKWIIIGRRNYRCVPSPVCISELGRFEEKRDGKTQYVFKTTYEGMLVL